MYLSKRARRRHRARARFQRFLKRVDADIVSYVKKTLMQYPELQNFLDLSPGQVLSRDEMTDTLSKIEIFFSTSCKLCHFGQWIEAEDVQFLCAVHPSGRPGLVCPDFKQ